MIHPGALSGDLRIALYSHDTCGLGHVRRNLAIAESFVSAHPGSNALVISGISESTVFPRKSGIDLITLPSLYKKANREYRSRWLDLDLADIIALRSRVIEASLSAFQPDVLVVDNVPRGAMGELNSVLSRMRRVSSTRIVLGLRDVIDAPQVVREEWRHASNFDFIRDIYDEIWIYGDPLVYDTPTEYAFPADLKTRVTFTGYLNRVDLERGEAETQEDDHAFLVCTVGGGQDGFPLAYSVALADVPANSDVVVVTGPYMPESQRRKLEALTERREGLRVERFRRRPLGLYRQANRVVSMGGYNTVVELLSLGQHPLLVPRVQPRREQLIRARRLQELGLVDVLHPEEVSDSSIRDWVKSPVRASNSVRDLIDLSGLEQTSKQLASSARARQSATSPARMVA